MRVFASVGFFEAGYYFNHILGVVEKVFQFIDDEFFYDLRRDGFDGAGLFYFGSGAGVTAIIFTIFLG